MRDLYLNHLKNKAIELSKWLPDQKNEAQALDFVASFFEGHSWEELTKIPDPNYDEHPTGYYSLYAPFHEDVEFSFENIESVLSENEDWAKLLQYVYLKKHKVSSISRDRLVRFLHDHFKYPEPSILSPAYDRVIDFLESGAPKAIINLTEHITLVMRFYESAFEREIQTKGTKMTGTYLYIEPSGQGAFGKAYTCLLHELLERIVDLFPDLPVVFSHSVFRMSSKPFFIDSSEVYFSKGDWFDFNQVPGMTICFRPCYDPIDEEVLDRRLLWKDTRRKNVVAVYNQQAFEEMERRPDGIFIF